MLTGSIFKMIEHSKSLIDMAQCNGQSRREAGGSGLSQ